MKLYYSRGACSLAVRILMQELNLASEFEAVDLPSKKTEKGIDFLTINPKGAVPTLLLDNGEILTENAVIQQYLADQQKATEVFPVDFNRYRVLEWLNFVGSDLHKSFSPLFNPEMSEEVKEKYKKMITGKLKIVEQQLSKSTYLAGDNFTLPDGYLFVILRWANYFKIDLNQFPNIIRYFELLKTRKSIQKALEEEKLAA